MSFLNIFRRNNQVVNHEIDTIQPVVNMSTEKIVDRNLFVDDEAPEL